MAELDSQPLAKLLEETKVGVLYVALLRSNIILMYLIQQEMLPLV